MRSLVSPAVLASAALLLSCQEGMLEPEPIIERQQKEIIGGTPDHADPAVVAVFAGGLCTGTLVAPEVVLTAAHCVGDAIVSGNTNAGGVRFGDGDGWDDSINIIDMAMHRLYKPPAFLQNDIALVRLQRASDVTPLPISTYALTEEDFGLQLRVVGFGNTDGEAGTGAGKKRQVRLPLRQVRPGHITIGDHLYNTCQGDSGGPTFAMFDGTEYVVGVTSYGATGCAGNSSLTRTDAMWDEFLTEVISAWSGPCKQDGECVEDESCAYPDPDCDPCGMDGVCVRDCPRPDKDCPLEGLAGDSCSDSLACESRHCVSSADDDRINYCAVACDPTAKSTDTGCYAPLTVCQEQADGTGLCRFPGITPGAQGYPCEDGAICRSGMCDSGAGICVEPCGGDLPECSEEYDCQSVSGVDICALPRDDSWCSVANSNTKGRGLGGLFLLLALAFVGRRVSRPVSRH